MSIATGPRISRTSRSSSTTSSWTSFRLDGVRRWAFGLPEQVERGDIRIVVEYILVEIRVRRDSAEVSGDESVGADLLRVEEAPLPVLELDRVLSMGRYLPARVDVGRHHQAAPIGTATNRQTG